MPPLLTSFCVSLLLSFFFTFSLQEARAQDPLLQLNQAFLENYSKAKDAVLSPQEPVLIVQGDTLILHYRHTRTTADISTPLYTQLKTISHVPLALYAIVSSHGKNEWTEAQLSSLYPYKTLIISAKQALEKYGYPAPLLLKQNRILDAAIGLIDQITAEHHLTESVLKKFTESMTPLLMENIESAVKARLDLLHSRVLAWKKTLPLAAWHTLKVVVLGPHQPRIDNVQMQYFERLLQADKTPHIILYGEGIFEEQQGLTLLKTVLLDKNASHAFFHTPTHLERDLLADAAARYLQHMQF